MKFRVQHDFGKAASSYDSHAMLQRDVARDLFNMSRQTLSQSGAILDAGCGTGYFHELMRSNKIYANITQLDLAVPMCRIASSYASSPPFGTTFTLAGDCEMLPLSPESFEVVFSSLAVQWTDILLSSREFARVLKSQGTLALATFGTDTLKELKASFATIDDLPHVNQFTHHKALIDALEQAGFNEVALHREQKIVYYSKVMSLMKNLKSLGATYKQSHRKSLYGKGFIEKLEQGYAQAYADEKGLPSTWDIYYILARK